jgi:hypothetical protein
MTIEEILLKPDAEILRVGLFVKIVVKEWHAITGLMPDACDCKLKGYLKTVRRFHNKNKIMNDKIYFEGHYYDISTIDLDKKAYICERNPNLAIKYGLLVVENKEIIQEPTQKKQNESTFKPNKSKKRSRTR